MARTLRLLGNKLKALGRNESFQAMYRYKTSCRICSKKKNGVSPFVKSNGNLLCRGSYCVEKRAGRFEFCIFIDILRKFTCMTEVLLFLYVQQEIKALQNAVRTFTTATAINGKHKLYIKYLSS